MCNFKNIKPFYNKAAVLIGFIIIKNSATQYLAKLYKKRVF
jgi:hypothetical protein